jgi:hypothetical protein
LTPVTSSTDDAVPSAITQLSALDGGEAGRKCADEHGCGQPKSGFGGGASRLVRGDFRLIEHVGNSLGRLCLIDARA